MAQVSRRNALVEEHAGLIRPIALSISNKLPPSFTLEDLEQMGALGLLAAAELYDPRRACWFGTYARMKIRGAILDGLRSAIAEGLRTESGDSEWQSGDENPEEFAMARERTIELKRALESLPPRQRQVLEMRYMGGLTQRATGAAMGGITQTATRSLEIRAIAALRKRLQAA